MGHNLLKGLREHKYLQKERKHDAQEWNSSIVPPSKCMLCQLQNGVISDGDNSQFRHREDLSSPSQREGVYQVHNINPRDPN